MKSLKKLTINAEKIIKNDALINLKGGSYCPCCLCDNGEYISASSEDDCHEDCCNMYDVSGEWEC